MREESAKRRTSTSHHSSGSSSGSSSSSSSTAWRLDDSLALRFIGIKTHPYLSLIRHKIRDDDEAAPRRLLTNRISVCWLSLSLSLFSPSRLLPIPFFLSFSLLLTIIIIYVPWLSSSSFVGSSPSCNKKRQKERKKERRRIIIKKKCLWWPRKPCNAAAAVILWWWNEAKMRESFFLSFSCMLSFALLTWALRRRRKEENPFFLF